MRVFVWKMFVKNKIPSVKVKFINLALEARDATFLLNVELQQIYKFGPLVVRI